MIPEETKYKCPCCTRPLFRDFHTKNNSNVLFCPHGVCSSTVMNDGLEYQADSEIEATLKKLVELFEEETEKREEEEDNARHERDREEEQREIWRKKHIF